MDIGAWLMGFGLVGAIARDIVKMYVGVKNSDVTEKEKLDAVFGMWSHKHINFASLTKDLKKSFRVEYVWKDVEKGGPRTLLEVFLYALSIEADVSPKDGSVFRKSIKVFESVAKKHKLDARDDCAGWYRALNIMEGKDPFAK
jgi:hypothetical protein